MKRCPECGHTRSWRLADGRLRCRRCRTRYRWTSAWDGVRLSEATKRRLLELFVFGVPGYRLRFRAGVSAPTIERFFRLVRACMALAEDLRAPFEGAVECDEAVFGGRRRGTKRGWGAPGKVIVVGILKRNGYVRVRAIDTHSERATVNLVCTHTRPGSLYYTDDWRAYASLALRGEHVVVRKERGRPLGRDHINGIEGFWSYAKHWLYPYRGVPRKLFHVYLGEIAYRFNHRDEDLFPLLIKQLKGTPRAEVDAILVQIR
jgi:transposase